MPALSAMGDLSTGHSCFVPTNIVGDTAQNSYVGDKLIAMVGSSLVTHSCGDTVHSGRKISSGASNTYIGSKTAARIGDPINCGDEMGQGASNTFVG